MNEPAAAQTRITFLGRFEVRRGDRVLIDASWPRRKAAALLKLLALQPNRSLHREQVGEELWPGQPPDAAANNLRQNLHHLRAALNGDASEEMIVANGDRLSLSAGVAIDIDEFRGLAKHARESRDGVGPHEQALAIYSGDLLPDDLYEPWTERPRRELHELRNRLLIEASELHEAAGDQAAATEYLQRVLAADHAAEPAHRALMRIYARSGQRQRALRQYERCKDVLKQELDVEPSEATVALYREIAGGSANGAPAPAIADEALAFGNESDESGRFWSHGWVRLVAGALLVILVTGAITGSLAMGGAFDDGGSAAAIEYTDLSYHARIAAVGRLVSGDCVSSDIVYTLQGGGPISGGLPGDSELQYTATFPVEHGCRLGYSEGSFTINDAEGTGISAVNFVLIPLANPVNGQPTGQSDQPGSVLMVTGLGAYAGLSGPGRCNIPQTSVPVSPTEIRASGEGDCFMTLGPTGEQSPVLMEAVTSWLQLAPLDSGAEVPNTLVLAAFYMNDTDEPLDGLRLRIPQPAGASLAVAHEEEEEFVAAHDRNWSLPEIGPGETAQFFVNIQLVSSSRDEIVVIPEIYGEGLDEPVRSSPLRLRVVQ